ncbi:Lrp/AsnC family transcriptional regulator [Roseivivax isoporae]|uniref:AsnC family transcriptional regulator n=1 Tax=Roseivivax isoporae LMG 25204 TaxID=1449351 RepID=X7FC82_9RHOB|nr:Lrp/AsnC family transcriptional regulator [Roseivivax isoporae]ETX29649.1 AsnC family transcriptional regulator [Roseivivax isoporae LMG 25204]
MPLDARDLDILRILSAEGRITKAELAARVGLSPTPCWERLKKLERAGVIEGYGARLGLRAFGPHVTVFVAIELGSHKAADFRIFEEAVQRHEEITWVWALGGGFDYLCQVVTRDIDSYQRLIDALLEARIGLSRYYTYIVTKRVKAGHGLPLSLLARD